MHPRISEVLDYVDRQTATLHDAYESVPLERRSIRAAPDRWSPAEIVRHLDLVEQRMVARLADLIEQARALPPETETTTVLSQATTTRIIDRTNRIVTTESLEPNEADAARVWDDLMRTRRAFVEVVASGDGLALGAVSLSHPRLGAFSGYDWIAFIGSHMARHAAQIRETNAALAARGD